jgi:hypothetical protein
MFQKVPFNDVIEIVALLKLNLLELNFLEQKSSKAKVV